MTDTKSPLEQLLDMWDTDSIIDSTEPGKALLDIPKLHAKYLRILSKHSLLSKKAGYDLQTIRKRMSDYYNGRMTSEELTKHDLKPFKFVLKNDVREYIDSDENVIKAQQKQANHDELVSVCNSILKELNNRTWQLRDFCAWEKFIAGQ